MDTRLPTIHAFFCDEAENHGEGEVSASRITGTIFAPHLPDDQVGVLGGWLVVIVYDWDLDRSPVFETLHTRPDGVTEDPVILSIEDRETPAPVGVLSIEFLGIPGPHRFTINERGRGISATVRVDLLLR